MLPKSVMVRRANYTITMVDKKIPFEDVLARGLCDGEHKTIQIYRKQSQRLILSTFFHELLHAIEYEYGVSLKHTHIFEIETPLADLFLKNPQMRAMSRLWKP